MFLREAIAKCLLELAENNPYWSGDEEKLVDYIIGRLDGDKSVRHIIKQILFSPVIQRECRRLGIDFSWCEMPVKEKLNDK